MSSDLGPRTPERSRRDELSNDIAIDSHEWNWSEALAAFRELQRASLEMDDASAESAREQRERLLLLMRSTLPPLLLDDGSDLPGESVGDRLIEAFALGIQGFLQRFAKIAGAPEAGGNLHQPTRQDLSELQRSILAWLHGLGFAEFPEFAEEAMPWPLVLPDRDPEQRQFLNSGARGSAPSFLETLDDETDAARIFDLRGGEPFLSQRLGTKRALVAVFSRLRMEGTQDGFAWRSVVVSESPAVATNPLPFRLVSLEHEGSRLGRGDMLGTTLSEPRAVVRIEFQSNEAAERLKDEEKEKERRLWRGRWNGLKRIHARWLDLTLPPWVRRDVRYSISWPGADVLGNDSFTLGEGFTLGASAVRAA